MNTTLIIAASITTIAANPAYAQDTLGAAVDKLTTSAIGGMAMGDHVPNKLDIERSPTGALLTSMLVGATVYNNRKQDTIVKIKTSSSSRARPSPA